MIDTRAGPGRTASTLAAPVLALCLLCVSGSRLAGQGMTGSYRVSGREVDLAVLPDSFAVSTVDPLSPGEVEALVSPVLSGAAAVRRLSPRIWVLGIDPMSRDALGEAVHDLEAIPDVVWAGFAVRAQDASGPAFVTRQFMARFQAGVPRAEIDALNRQHAVEIVSEPSILPQHYGLRVTVASDGDALEMARIYDTDPRTVYAHPNLIVTDEPAASWFPTNDPLFSSQWHHYNPGVVISGIRADIHSPEAWGIELGDPNVVIAVLELGGFQTGHPDLAANLWVNPWADGTGPFPNKTGDVHGWNFEGCVWGAAPELDPCGSANLFPDPTEVHGTQVAGMAAEVRDNGVGGLGVCPDCSLMLVRLSMTKDQGVRALGFQYADLMGADVVNVSFNTQYTDPTLVDVVSQAATFGRAGKGITPAPGLTIVAAAPDFFQSFPTNFCTLGTPVLSAQNAVLSVTSTDDMDQPANGAFGACLDLSAPGEAVWTTTPMNAYGAQSGTSFAAPVVAGVAGLLLSRKYDLTRSQIYQILTETADKVGTVPYDPSGRNDIYGHGRVNAFNALGHATVTVSTASASAPPPPATGAWEVGVRAGLSVLNGPGATENRAGLPGAGALGAPAVYGTWFPSGSPLLVDLQLGLSRAWSSAYDERFIELALMPAVEVAFGSVTLYLGPTAAVELADTGSGWTTEWGVGGVLGSRWPLSAALRLRTEILGRSWSGISVDEWGLGVGFGVMLP